MDGTRPKSIFDIPKPIPTAEEMAEAEAKGRKKRSKTPKRKRPKTAKAGGVEVSQIKGSSKSQITLKQKGGLTQEITIYTGDKPNPRVGRGKSNPNTPNWNMKPAKFKKSRGLRDDRVYLQPPKREYFGNRYKSALDKIKIDQKVAEAGASKNKEIADVRDRANREKRELERREKAKEDTISELRREKAGIVASHNVSQRNQSRATILGGDVGELNKLINRRGYDAIRRLVLKGEITDISTILQLDLDEGQINRLTTLLEGERADYTRGSKLVYLTGRGIAREGTVLDETDKFVRMRKPDGGEVKVPKVNIQTGVKVAEARGVSADPAVRVGRSIPTGADFGSPRPAGSSAEERPAFRRDVGAGRRRQKAEEKQKERREATGFVGEVEQQFTESSSSAEDPKTSPETKLRKTIGAIREGLQTTLDTPSVRRSPTPNLDALRAETITTAPSAVVEESDISSGLSGEDESQPQPQPESLALELQSEGEESSSSDATLTALGQFQRSQLLGSGYGGLGDILEGRPRIGAIQTEEDIAIQRGRAFGNPFVPTKSIRGLTPRQLATEERRRQREESQERVSAALQQSQRVSSRTTQYLQRTAPPTVLLSSGSEQEVEYTKSDLDAISSGEEGNEGDTGLVIDSRDTTARLDSDDSKLYYQGKELSFRRIQKVIDEVFKDNETSRKVATRQLETSRKRMIPFKTKNKELLRALGISTAYSPTERGDDDL